MYVNRKKGVTPGAGGVECIEKTWRWVHCQNGRRIRDQGTPAVCMCLKLWLQEINQVFCQTTRLVLLLVYLVDRETVLGQLWGTFICKSHSKQQYSGLVGQ